jgi:hypothetical protein
MHEAGTGCCRGYTCENATRAARGASSGYLAIPTAYLETTILNHYQLSTSCIWQVFAINKDPSNLEGAAAASLDFLLI